MNAYSQVTAISKIEDAHRYLKKLIWLIHFTNRQSDNPNSTHMFWLYKYLHPTFFWREKKNSRSALEKYNLFVYFVLAVKIASLFVGFQKENIHRLVIPKWKKKKIHQKYVESFTKLTAQCFVKIWTPAMKSWFVTFVSLSSTRHFMGSNLSKASN